MKTKIIGARNAGDYGVEVGGKCAWIINNRGGMGCGHLERGTCFRRRSNAEAEKAAMEYLGWDRA